MNEARTTTLVRRPPARRASDRNRSRLGDLTRPIAREQRISRDRRPTIIFSIVALVIAGAIGAALFGLPVRTWFEQDRQLDRLERELNERESVNAELQSEVDRLQVPAGVVEAAREELGLVEVGENLFTVPGLPALPADLPDGWPTLTVEQIITLRTAGP